MKYGIIGILLLAFFTLTFSQSNAQQIKVGVVDLQKIVTELPEAKEAENQLLDLTQKYQDTLNNMQAELEKRYQTYQKQKTMMQPNQVTAEEQALQQMQVQWQQFREAKFGTMGELNKKRMSLLEPIEKKVREAIEKVAKSEALNFVFNKNAQILLFSEEKYDITFKVLDMLKRG